MAAALCGNTRDRASIRKYARVVAYAVVQWPALGAILILSLILSALAALQPWPLKMLVDYGFGDVQPADSLITCLSALGVDPTRANLVVVAALAGIALFAVNAALDSAVTWAWSAVGQRIVYDLAGDLFLQLQRLSLLFHARRNVGDSITRITTDAWCVYTVTDGVLISPARHLCVLAFVSAIAWQLDASLTVLMIAVAPLLAGSALYFGERLKGFERQKRSAEAAVASFLHQVIGAMPLVQAFATGTRNRQLFSGLADNAVQANRSAALVTDAYGAVNGIFVTIGIVLVLYVGGQRVLAHELSVGSLLAFIAYLRALETASRGLLTTYGKLRAAAASMDRVLEVLDATEAVRDAPAARSLPEALANPGGHLV